MGDAAYSATAAFYENLAGALFGYTHKRKRVTDSENEHQGYPDLIHTRKAFGLEVKSIAPGRTLDLRDNQMEYLADFQLGHPSYKLSFVVFRYNTPEPSLPEMKPTELINFLTGRATAYALVLPFDVVSALHQRGVEKGLGFRYEGGKEWRSRLRVNSGVVDRLARDPTSVLERLGLDPSRYRITRSLSPGVRCHGITINSSPLVRLSNPRYREWVNEQVSTRALNLEEQSDLIDSEDPEKDSYELDERTAIAAENSGQPLLASGYPSVELPI